MEASSFVKNMKINILRTIFIILLIGTLGIIFGFSSQDSEKSSSISRRVTEFLTDRIGSIQEKPEQEKEQILFRVEKIVRKIAHFFSYSLIIGVIYASSDEIHQCFTPGRGPLVTDIILDGMGVLLGILLVMLVVKIFEKILLKKKKRQNITEYDN